MKKKIGKPKNKLIQLQILKSHNKKKSYYFSTVLKKKNRGNYELFYIKLNNEYRYDGN